MRRRFHLKLFGVELFMLFRRERKKLTYGIANRTQDGKYVPFMDFDNHELDWVVGEIKRLQKQFNLGDFHIMQSSEGSYHALGFDKVTWDEFIEIMDESTADLNFIVVPQKYGKKTWVLRFTDKHGKDAPTHIKIIRRSSTRKKSTTHKEFMRKLYKVNIPKTPLDDGSTTMFFVRYKT